MKYKWPGEEVSYRDSFSFRPGSLVYSKHNRHYIFRIMPDKTYESIDITDSRRVFKGHFGSFLAYPVNQLNICGYYRNL